jgi:RNA polymerase sigma-70 factor, ECF subfamily
VYRILTNTFIASYRKRQSEPQPAPADGIQDWQLARAVSRPSFGLKPACTEVLDHLPDPLITCALRQLCGDFRTVVYLADVERYAYREIAGIMGTPIGTVTPRLRRGHGQLAQLLRDYAAARCPATMAGGAKNRVAARAGDRGRRQDR